MKKLLQEAKVKIKKEMTDTGFIDDSDCTERFLDLLAKELAEGEILKGNKDIDFYYEKEEAIEDLSKKILDEIKGKIMNEYKIFSTSENGHYEACYYEVDEEFSTWNEFNDHFGLGE